jgi:hypothetical protein
MAKGKTLRESFGNFNQEPYKKFAEGAAAKAGLSWGDMSITKCALQRLATREASMLKNSNAAADTVVAFMDEIVTKLGVSHPAYIKLYAIYEPISVKLRTLDWNIDDMRTALAGGEAGIAHKQREKARALYKKILGASAANKFDQAWQEVTSIDKRPGQISDYHFPCKGVTYGGKKYGIPYGSRGDYFLTVKKAVEVDVGVKAYKEYLASPEYRVNQWMFKSGLNASGLAGARGAAKMAERAHVATRTGVQQAVTTAIENLYAEQIIYNEQCFLLAGLLPIINQKITAEQTGTGSARPLPYVENDTNATLLVEGDPYGFINKLTQYDTTQYFHDMATRDISSLQPMIHLYKITSAKNGEPQEQRIHFATSPGYKWPHGQGNMSELKMFLKDKGQRGFGAGIKDFTFTYEGSNPFGVKKSIKAKLTIVANTFQELLVDRGGYSYIDLALKTGISEKKRAQIAKKKSQKQEDIDRIEDALAKLDFRLKAVVGWAKPEGALGGFSSNLILDAINNSYITLNLTPTIHEFGIDQMGRVTFTINYLAYVEDFFDQPSFNIFSSNIEAMKGIISRKVAYKALSKKCKGEEITKLKEQDKDKISKEKADSMSSLIKALIDGEKIKYITLTREQLDDFNKRGPAFFKDTGFKVQVNDDLDTSNLNGALAQAFQKGVSGSDDKAKQALHVSLLATDPTQEQLAFFYASDLIDVVLSGIGKYLKDMPTVIKDPKSVFTTNTEITPEDRKRELEKLVQFEKRFRKLRVLLGPIELNDGNDISFVTLGDLPIAVKYFGDWLTKKVSAKDSAFYTLTKFLNDFFNDLVREFLNNDRCFLYSFKQKTRIQQTSLCSYRRSNQPYDEITTIMTDWNRKLAKTKLSKAPMSRSYLSGLYKASNRGKGPILNIAGYRGKAGGNPGVSLQTDWLIYFVGRTQPTERMNGIKSEDLKNGIYHYMVGRDKGIVKTIDLQKTDTPGLTEVRFEQEGYDGLEQLRLVYDTTIKTYANVQAFPGTYIYVDPYGFAPSILTADGNSFDLTKFGIGGYHMVTRSEHSFGAGKAESTITAKWVAQIDRTGDPGKPAGASDGSPSKCATLLTKRKEKTQPSTWDTFKSALGFGD